MSKTAMVVLATCIMLGIYDLYAVTYYGIDGTISRYIQCSAFEAPVIPFVFGCLAGHFFFYMPHTKMTKELRKNLIENGWQEPEDFS